MYPQTVALILIIIMGFSLIQYYFIVPAGIQPNNNQQNMNNSNGYWGSPNSDFDWCEYNYLLTQYIAEPWNSITSLLYVIVSMIGNYYFAFTVPKHIYNNSKDIQFLGWILVAIGCGSTLFHSTLLYQTQLVDELPMYFLVSYASVVLFTRYDSQTNPNKQFYLNILNTINCAVISLVAITTDKSSLVHQFWRCFESIMFAVFFVYLFYVGAKCGNEIFKLNPQNKHYVKISVFYDKSFIAFFIALIGWLLDNFYCNILQNMKIFEFSVPYLHLHAFLWHVGTAIGLHYFLLVIIAHRIIMQYNMDIECITVMCGILPYVRAIPAKKVQ